MRCIEQKTWGEVRQKVKQKNKALFELIEAISPDNTLSFTQIRYHFGDPIIQNGRVQLPEQADQLISIDETDLSDVAKNLSYSAIPLGLLLNKTSEIYIESLPGHISPLKTLTPGYAFGLFEVVNQLCGIKQFPVWSVSAGARSLMMLPKLSEKGRHHRLCKAFNCQDEAPRTHYQQWDVFRQIANSPSSSTNWHSDVLFFNEPWFLRYKEQTTDKAWQAFYSYLFSQSWFQAQYIQNDTLLNLIWQTFSMAIGKRNMRPRTYLVDTLKMLISISIGAAPGFCFVDDETSAPIGLLQSAYEEIYRLQHYAPTFLMPHNLMPGFDDTPVYYSLSVPTIIEGMPDHKYSPPILEDLREMRRLLDTLLSFQATGVLKQMINSILEARLYYYFHVDEDREHHIDAANSLVSHDQTLSNILAKYPQKQFCDSSSFMKGCIMVKNRYS